MEWFMEYFDWLNDGWKNVNEGQSDDGSVRFLKADPWVILFYFFSVGLLLRLVK